MISLYERVKAWHSFLSRQEWDLFVTITFKGIKSRIGAIKAFKYFFKNINTHQEKLFNNFIKCFVVLKETSGREGVHVHSFIKGIKPSCAGLLERRCNQFFGQSRVLAYNPNKRGSFYLSKKCIRPTKVDYDFFTINSKLRTKRRSHE